MNEQDRILGQPFDLRSEVVSWLEELFELSSIAYYGSDVPDEDTPFPAIIYRITKEPVSLAQGKRKYVDYTVTFDFWNDSADDALQETAEVLDDLVTMNGLFLEQSADVVSQEEKYKKKTMVYSARIDMDTNLAYRK